MSDPLTTAAEAPLGIPPLAIITPFVITEVRYLLAVIVVLAGATDPFGINPCYTERRRVSPGARMLTRVSGPDRTAGVQETSVPTTTYFAGDRAVLT